MKPTVPEVLPLVAAYYDGPKRGAGGSLHIVLDDGNVSDSHVEFCVLWAQKATALDFDSGPDPEGEVLGRLLLRMSRSQRARLAARHYVEHAKWSDFWTLAEPLVHRYEILEAMPRE